MVFVEFPELAVDDVEVLVAEEVGHLEREREILCEAQRNPQNLCDMLLKLHILTLLMVRFSNFGPLKGFAKGKM